MNQVARPRTSAFERRVWQTIAVVGSLAVWLAYDAVTFVVSCLSVADSGRSFAWYDWEFTAGVIAVPTATLGVATAIWIRRHKGVPVSAFGRTMAIAQALGLAGLVTALLYPILTLSSYFHPSFEISVENRTSEIIAVWADGPEYSGCADYEIVQPGTTANVRLGFTSYECWGQHAVKLAVNRGFGHWECDWKVAKSHEPLIITVQGPNC